MKPYLSQAKFRTMGFGVDVSEMDDKTLTALCQRAHSLVDAHCLVPRLPQVHDFRGGTAIGEQHAWRYPETPFDVGQRRAHPYHWPIQSVERFWIKVTNTQYVSIDGSELFINNSLKYVEVVSLAITSAGLFNALVVPNIGLATPTLEMDYTYGRTFAETDEVLEFTDGFTWRAAHQWWKTSPAPVIKKNDTTLTVDTDYTVDFDEGTVTLVAAADDDDIIYATYTRTLPYEIRDAMGYTVAALASGKENYERGMGNLRRLTIEEVTLERQNAPRDPSKVAHDLTDISPEAAALLASFRFDGVTIR